jgi:hypothetical protein
MPKARTPKRTNAGEQHKNILSADAQIAAPPLHSDDDEAQLRLERPSRRRSSPSDPNAGEQHIASVNAIKVVAASRSPSDGDDAHRLDVRQSRPRSSPSDPALVCLRLAELQVSRKFTIKATNRQINAAASLIRRALGFDPNASEKERKAVKARALRMATRAFARKPQDAADESAFLLVETDVNVVTLAIAPLIGRRKEVEKEMIVAARSLPVWQWAKAVAGLGEIGLPVIVGETGDLSRYPNFRHVWKRLGLMPFEGKACSVWRRGGGMPEGGWERVGYSPRRRAEIHACVGEPLLKHQIASRAKTNTEFGSPKGRYGEVYVARRERMKLLHPDWPKAHAKADALRIMTKALIADLWLAWPRVVPDSFEPEERISA